MGVNGKKKRGGRKGFKYEGVEAGEQREGAWEGLARESEMEEGRSGGRQSGLVSCAQVP